LEEYTMTPPSPFLVGVNLPWIRYGGDFGANAWHPAGGVHLPERQVELETACARMADAGMDLVRWFVLADGRAGLVERADGRIVGIDDHVRRDLEAALAILDRYKLRAICALTDYTLCAPARVVAGVRTGGRRHLVARPADRDGFMAHVVEPLVASAGASDVVYAWDVINEPEWVTWREGTRKFWRAVSPGTMRGFVAAVVDRIHAAGARATVGLASTRGLDLVRGLGLDLYQVHWYDHVIGRAALKQGVAAYELDAPLLLGEFPSHGSACSVAEVLGLAREAGYCGALGWSLLASDDFSAGGAGVDESAAWRGVE
jgi:hypothetical protein